MHYPHVPGHTFDNTTKCIQLIVLKVEFQLARNRIHLCFLSNILDMLVTEKAILHLT